jgi:UDP-glucose:(heptosyl)LPS alpha-1,3-glucosyltransferase
MQKPYDIIQGLGKTTCQTIHRTGGGVHRAYLERLRPARPSLYDRVAIHIEDELYRSTRLRAIVCAAKLIASEVERFYPLAAERIRIIPNGVETRLFSPEGRDPDRARLRDRLGLAADAVVLLFMGTNFRRKGLAFAIDALPRLPGVHLVVAGGDSSGTFEARAAAAEVRDRVHFIGFQAIRPPVYRAADVVVLPTHYDPFANVCLESLACGTPVVTSDHNGAASILEGALAGAISPLLQGGLGVAAAVKQILARGPAVREGARNLALRHDQERHLDAVEELYRTVVLSDELQPQRGS